MVDYSAGTISNLNLLLGILIEFLHGNVFLTKRLTLLLGNKEVNVATT